MEFKNQHLYLLDQRKLPLETSFFKCKTYQQVEFAIKDMVVRIATEGVKVYNPAFDVTPSENISGIITEKEF